MEQSVKKIPITLSDTAQWHALLGRAEYLLQHCLPEDVTHYLVRLFLSLTREDMSQENILLVAGEMDGDADERLQRVADRCLMIAGFYPDIASVYDVTTSDFVKMGRHAYRAMASHADPETALVYSYLDKNFIVTVNILNRIMQLSSANVHAVVNTGIQPANTDRDSASVSTAVARALASRQLN